MKGRKRQLGDVQERRKKALGRLKAKLARGTDASGQPFSRVEYERITYEMAALQKKLGIFST